MKKNSQHYRFASFVGDIPSETNLCPYIRKFIGGLTLFVFVSTLFAVWLIGNLLTIAAVAGGDFGALLAMDADRDPWFIVVTLLTLLTIVIVGGFYGAHRFSEWRRERKYAVIEAKYQRQRAIENGELVEPPTPEPSFLRQWYNSVHDKVCPVVKFE